MIDYIELRAALQNLTRQQKLYRLLKQELSVHGYWKNKNRGAEPPKQEFTR